MNRGNAKTKESLCIRLHGGVVDRCSCRLTMSSGQHDSTTLERDGAGGRKVPYVPPPRPTLTARRAPCDEMMYM